MIAHFNVVPVHYAAAAEALLSAARRDPAILIVERRNLGTLIVLCSDADDVAETRQFWEQHGKLSEGLSTIQLLPAAGLVLVEQSGEHSQARLAGFLAPLLRTFPIRRIFDADSEALVTDASYEALFVDEE